MKIITHVVDISQQLQQGIQPNLVITQGSAPDDSGGVFVSRYMVDDYGPWRVLHARVDGADDPNSWSDGSASVQTYVPLQQYMLKTAEATELVRFGVEIAYCALNNAVTHQLIGKERVEQLLLVIGNVYQRTDKPGFVCWLGIAIKLKQ